MLSFLPSGCQLSQGGLCKVRRSEKWPVLVLMHCAGIAHILVLLQWASTPVLQLCWTGCLTRSIWNLPCREIDWTHCCQVICLYSDQTGLPWPCEMINLQSVIKLTFIVIFSERRVNTWYIDKGQSISICQKGITPTKFDRATIKKTHNSYFHPIQLLFAFETNKILAKTSRLCSLFSNLRFSSIRDQYKKSEGNIIQSIDDQNCRLGWMFSPPSLDSSNFLFANLFRYLIHHLINLCLIFSTKKEQLSKSIVSNFLDVVFVSCLAILSL